MTGYLSEGIHTIKFAYHLINFAWYNTLFVKHKMGKEVSLHEKHYQNDFFRQYVICDVVIETVF